MKSNISRSIIYGVLSTFVFLLVLMAIVFITFPLNDWMELWDRKVVELPFVLFIVTVAIVFGATTGLFTGLLWRKQLLVIEEAVWSLDQRNSYRIDDQISQINELNPIIEKLGEVHQFIHEQTKRTQKLINDRVEDQEQQIQRVISEERNRLARELHDSVSQELFAASMMVSAINESNLNSNEMITKQLKQIEAMIQQAQLEMRALLLHLRPIALKDNSLKDGIEQLLVELKQKVPLEITWKIEPVELSRGVEDHLFRILQESVSNTLRHAKANELDVLFIERDDFVILRVVDDGIGFAVEESQSSSYGLANMQERAAEIGANLRIISVPNQGTRLEVRVPIIDTEGDELD